MFNIALKIFLFLSPIVFIPLWFPATATLQFYQFGSFGNNIGISQNQFFCYAVIILFLISFFCEPQRKFKDVIFGALFLVSILSFYFHPSTIKSFLFVFLGFILYHLISVYTKMENFKSVFMVVFFVSLLNLVFSIFQSFGINFIYSNGDCVVMRVDIFILYELYKLNY